MSNDHADLRLLILAEEGAIFQLSKRTLIKMIQKKEVPAFKVGGQCAFERVSLKNGSSTKRIRFPRGQQDVKRCERDRNRTLRKRTRKPLHKAKPGEGKRLGIASFEKLLKA